ncbi:hypothetical protein [Flavimobilis soli]|nr:hypothetical protein [Flavimobilis soli]
MASNQRPEGEQPVGAPSAPTIVAAPTTSQIVARSVSGWRTALAARAGGSSLADIRLLGDAVLDLTAAHPSGIAQLFAGRPTQLANIFREGVSLPTARRRARAVAARAKEQTERYGIAPTYLAIGIATWTEEVGDESADDVAALARIAGAAPDPAGSTDDEPRETRRTVRAPVLLRPLRLQARGSGESDYELMLETSAELNPVLSRALRARGALLDPVALAQSAFDSGAFAPSIVTDRVHALGSAVLTDFTLTEKLVVGSFVHPGQALVDDLDELSGLDHHEVVAALATLAYEDEHLQAHAPATTPTRTSALPAGAVAADAQDDDATTVDEAPLADPTDDVAAAVARAFVPQTLPEVRQGDEDPADERGVGDLDPAQRHLLDAVTSGRHVFVDAPAGADVPGTVAAVVADAAASGRSVLYVPGHRRAAEQVVARMESLGLSDLLMDIEPSPTWRAGVSRRLLAAMTLEPPYIDRHALGRLRADLIDTRRRLAGYIESLHLVRRPWGVSAYDVLQALARLTAARPSPSTHVRLSPATTAALTDDVRQDAIDTLIRVSELGAFTIRPTSTPWYGADLVDDEAARDAYARADRLANDLLPRLDAQIEQVRASSGLVEPTSLRAWGEQLAMIAGLRTTLDVFQPIIFERTAADLVAATATPKWRAMNAPEMTGRQRRRLAKQAKDMLRPGTRVDDLHGALVQVQAQREQWTAMCPGGGWPRLPEGLAVIEATYREVLEDVEALEPVLASTPAGGGLLDMPIAALVERTERLAADRAALDTLPERTALLRDLRAAGLSALVDDLRDRHVSTGLVGPELELAWWSSVFEEILRQDVALAAYDGAALEALAARFRELDRAHVAALPGPVLTAAIGEATLAMRKHPEDTEELFAELLEGRFTGLRDTTSRYGHLLRSLRPVTVASPTLVPHILPPTRTVDLVILDAVQHLPAELLVPAIARARQVVVIGDARSASGAAVRDLARVLPTVPLRAQVSSRDQELVEFLTKHGYGDVLRPTPLPVSRDLIDFQTVDASGMPDATTGTVQTTQGEVERVVELAIEHALVRPEESLAIITLSELHADRVREALLGEVRRNPALSSFFDPAAHEPVVIADLSAVAGLSRDAVIMSVGFGRTPHGRVLHRFGAVSEPAGEAMLLDALGVSRARLTVVSCFGYEDLDPERLRTPGARLLGDLLEFVERRAAQGPRSMLADGMETDLNPDRLVIDLAERLWRAGLMVETDFGMRGGERIPLVVGHPDLPDRMLVAVLTDDAAYVAEPSVRVRDRQRAERLEALGWTVVQVWSAAAFLDPVKEASRIRQVVLDVAASMFEQPMFGGREAANVPVTLPAVVDPIELERPVEPVAGEASGDVVVEDAPCVADVAVGAAPVDDVAAPAVAEPVVAPRDDAPEQPVRPVDGVVTPSFAAAISGETPRANPYAPGWGAPAWAPVSGETAADVSSVASAHETGVAQSTLSSGSARSSVSGVSAATAASAASTAEEAHVAPAAAADVVSPGSASEVVEGARHTGPESVMQGGFAMVGGVQVDLVTAASDTTVESVRAPRPDVQPGLPINAYGDNEIDELAAWIRSDGIERDAEQLAGALRAELGVVRRSNRVDAAVNAAVRRALEG